MTSLEFASWDGNLRKFSWWLHNLTLTFNLFTVLSLIKIQIFSFSTSQSIFRSHIRGIHLDVQIKSGYDHDLKTDPDPTIFWNSCLVLYLPSPWYTVLMTQSSNKYVVQPHSSAHFLFVHLWLCQQLALKGLTGLSQLYCRIFVFFSSYWSSLSLRFSLLGSLIFLLLYYGWLTYGVLNKSYPIFIFATRTFPWFFLHFIIQ